MPLLRKLDDRPRLVTSLLMRMVADGAALYETVPLPDDETRVSSAEAAACSEEALRIAREMDWPAGESFVLWETGIWLAPHGVLRPRARLRRGRAWPSRSRSTIVSGSPPRWLWSGMVYLDIAAWSEAEDTLTQALARAREVSSENFLSIAAAGLASTFIAQRRLAEASALLQARISPETPMDTLGQRMCWMVWGELRLAAASAPDALGYRASIDRDGRTGRGPAVWHLRGDALAALGRTAEAVDVLRSALLEAERLRVRARQWRIAASLGPRTARAGPSRGVGTRPGRARQTLHDLALEIDDPALRATFLRETALVVPPAPSASPSRAAKAALRRAHRPRARSRPPDRPRPVKSRHRRPVSAR